MSNQVLLKKSSVAAKVPLTTDLAYGELALNYADGKLYYKDSSNAIKSFTDDTSTVTLTGTQTLTNKTLTSPTLNTATANNLTLTGTLTAGGGVGSSGQVLTSTVTGVQWSTVSGGGSGTTTHPLTIGTGLSGTSFDGSSAVTIAIDSTVATLTGSQTLTNKTLDNTNTISSKASLFTLQDATDTTKTANFVLSGLTTATNYTYALPALSGSTLAVLGLAQTFSTTQTFSSGINVSGNNITFSPVATNFTCSTQTTGVITLGGASQTGTITLGRSTVSQTTNIQAGATASGSTKTINLGTGGLTGSTTTIAIGSTFGTTVAADGTWTFSTALANSNLANSSVTVGTTAISLGSSSTTLAGLTSIDATSGSTSFFATPTAPALFAAGTAVTIGATTGTTTVRNGLVVTGDLTVNGTTTTINSTVTSVDDIEFELGSVATPTDITAAGGGIRLKGATDKTINWASSTGWSSSEDFNVVTGKVFRIDGTSVLSGTTLGSGVTGSSLTSVGTITSGTWSGSFGAVSGANLTSLTAGNLSGTIPSAVLGNSTVYIGTTAVALNRSSASLALTGISSIDGSAATLTTPRSIYGNNFDGSAGLTGIIASTYGGTGNGFTKFSGPTTAEKTFTLPDATATILTSNAAVTIAQGGTGQTSKTAAYDALSPLTTKGDLVAYDGTDNVRLPVGTDTYVLTADSTTATGVKWAAGGGGGSALTVKDEGTSLSTSVTSIDFVGAGVAATNTGGAVTVTISGGGGSSGVDFQTYTATASQTTFAVSYAVPYVNVYVNGVRLSDADYTATSGSSVILATACSVNDIVNLVGFTSVSVGYGLPRVVTLTDATSVTFNSDTTDMAIQTNTQTAGTLTINAPSGTPSNGQKMLFRLQSTNAQTFSFNAIFTGSTDLSLPTASSGSSKYDYMGFIYNATATKWQLAGKNFGF